MARKKSEELIIPVDKPKAARRESRAQVGPVRPARPIPPATRRPPKHKKKELDEQGG